ncbi:MAG: MarR family transcriptional regulator, partial [Lactococcus lactis]|nr:MarR family transcriptional regulator [Lactococcus lactis]
MIRMRTKKEAIGRLLKVASNQMYREFDNFAAQLDLTGQQMSILDFL